MPTWMIEHAEVHSFKSPKIIAQTAEEAVELSRELWDERRRMGIFDHVSEEAVRIIILPDEESEDRTMEMTRPLWIGWGSVWRRRKSRRKYR